MSDHDAAPDPIDEAYVRAEALLSDEAQRAARRARVLAAVAGQPDSASSEPARAARRSAWRPGGWLAAACVAGLSVFIAVKIYHPVSPRPQTEQAAPTAAPSPTSSASSPGPSVATPAPVARPALRPSTPASGGTAPAPAPTKPTTSAPLQAPERPADAALAPSPAPASTLPAAPPPAPLNEPVRRAFPEEPPPPPPPVVAKAGRGAPPANDVADRGRDEAAEAQDSLALPESRRASSESFAAAPAGVASGKREASSLPPDAAARLRAAAAAGRTAEVESLLDRGAPADAPDAEGNTALIESVQADHPATAAALRRHGASLDHRNRAGKSARDIAAAKDDPALDRAIGPAR